MVFSRSFDNALGRILARKKRSEKDFHQVFEPVLITIASAFSFRTDSEPGEMAISEELVSFIRRYIAAMAKRSTDWTEERSTEIAGIELKRALDVFRSKCAEVSELQDADETLQNGDHLTT